MYCISGYLDKITIWQDGRLMGLFTQAAETNHFSGQILDPGWNTLGSYMAREDKDDDREDVTRRY